MSKFAKDVFVRLYKRYFEDERGRTNREYLTSRGWSNRKALYIHRLSRHNERVGMVLTIPLSLAFSGWVLETNGSGFRFGVPTGPRAVFVSSCLAVFIIGVALHRASASYQFGRIARYCLEASMTISAEYRVADEFNRKRGKQASVQAHKETMKTLYRASWQLYSANRSLCGSPYMRNDYASEYTSRLLQWHGNNTFNARTREHALNACLEQLSELSRRGPYVLPPRHVPLGTPALHKKRKIRPWLLAFAVRSVQAPLIVAIVTVILSTLTRKYF